MVTPNKPTATNVEVTSNGDQEHELSEKLSPESGKLNLMLSQKERDSIFVEDNNRQIFSLVATKNKPQRC